MSLSTYLTVLLVGATLGMANAGTVQASPRAALPVCAAVGNQSSLAGAQDAKEIQRIIPTHPFFLRAAAGSRFQSCTVRFESEGRLELQYRFRGEESLRVVSDPRLEHTSITAAIRLARDEQAETILLQAERASYGSGCGLDMAHPQKQAVKGEAGISETVYQGSACNCRGTIRRDAKSKLTGFVLSMAC